MRLARSLSIALNPGYVGPALSVLRAASSRIAMKYWRLGLLAVLTSSAPAHAILSCQAGAGFTLGGAFDECAPLSSKFQATAIASEGSASVNATTGSVSGSVTVSPSTIADGRFYGELIADFRISGPASGGSVPVQFIFSSSGSIAAECANCDANLGYSHQIDSVSFSGFRMRTSGGRTLSSPAWVTSSETFDTSGLGLVPTAFASAVGDTASGILSFDAAMVLGQTFRLTTSLSGNAHLTGPNAPTATLTVASDHTALFNILLPAGYTLSAEPSHYPLLTAPILLAVPEPSSYGLMAAGLGFVWVAARRRMRPERVQSLS